MRKISRKKFEFFDRISKIQEGTENEKLVGTLEGMCTKLGAQFKHSEWE